MHTDFIVITDIGSTTTKALLLKKENETYSLVDYVTARTTVEHPENDVKIGISQSIHLLEKKNQVQIFKSSGNGDQSFSFLDNVTYLTTSSAGGGLQILVIGLTKIDSAASAQRAAFGVGGVLLDTIAIDDRRTVMEQLQIINTTHPDIILFCGGVDGGALFSVYRLAEILKLSRITQKFSSFEKIPLVFAGNTDAQAFIQSIFRDRFNLHIVENLRPTMQKENLEPAKEKIHELFMNNVMEQAPGYSDVKSLVSRDIIPTPAGVLNTLRILGNKYRSVFAFDIGGATTDVFSNILGHFHRTVSANYGMSYSIGNVCASTDFVSDILPSASLYFADSDSFREYFYDYIGNKIIYPEFCPENETDKFIECLMAIKSMQLSIAQHHDMHFSIKRVGFLDSVKAALSRDKWIETMYYPHYDKSYIFSMSDVEVAIGAGGVFTHATASQAIYMLIEALRLDGVTELYRDKYFISPHMGVLSQMDEEIAESLIFSHCLEKLAIYMRPMVKSRKDKRPLLSVWIGDKEHTVPANDIFYFTSDSSIEIKITCSERCHLAVQDCTIEKGIPLIIDTRKIGDSPDILLRYLNPFPALLAGDKKMSLFQRSMHDSHTITPSEVSTMHFVLPYQGDIMVNLQDKVKPDTVLAEIRFDPPKIFAVLIPAMLQRTLTEDECRDGIKIAVEQKVSVGDTIYKSKSHKNIFYADDSVYSPVRGIVESIDYASGVIILREIQDYPLKPVQVNVASAIGIKGKNIRGYLKKRQGDFIYAGETLATNHSTKYKSLISPYTGSITHVDTQKGTITICFDKKPTHIYANSYGVVEDIIDHSAVQLSVSATQIEGKIGFGDERGGLLGVYTDGNTDYHDMILYIPHIKDFEQLLALAEMGVKGIITNTIAYSTLKRFLDRDIGIAITGNEKLPLSLVILHGFTDTLITDDSKLFDKYVGKYTLLKPHTQIRAGATRPKVAIMQE
jgi:uncharacterized protein (TIGR01319 family)